MFASNFNNIQNHFLLEQTEKMVNLDIVSQQQFVDLERSIPVTKTNSNILVRIGFFLLGNFLISSVLGFFTMFLTSVEGQTIFGFCFLLAGIMAVVSSEFLRKKNYFSYGLDDSFILSISTFFAIATGLFSESVLLVLVVVVFLTCLCAIRYVHVPSAFFSIIALVVLVGYFTIEEKIIPSYYLPILLFFVAICLYFLELKVSEKIENFIYKNIVKTIKIFSLLLGYVSLNYFVVRKSSEMLLGVYFSPEDEIPLAMLFYFATFAIPVFYIVYGLKKKDRVFFWIGLLTLVLAFATIRYYYSLLPAEIALILAGLILFVVVYFSIQKTKNNVSGITFKEDKNINPMAFNVVKSLLVNANVNVVATTTQQSPMEFGGGGFSGGGSGESF